jgi:hypothetical protein
LRENNIFSISPSLPPLFARLVMAASGLNFFNGIGTNGRKGTELKAVPARISPHQQVYAVVDSKRFVILFLFIYILRNS